MAQPIFTCDGGEIDGNPFDGYSYIDLTKPPNQFDSVVGPELSVAFTARIDVLGGQLLWFGHSQTDAATDNTIYVYSSNGNDYLWFGFRGSGFGNECPGRSNDGIKLGEAHEYLFTAKSADGVKLFRDGKLVGEEKKRCELAAEKRPYMSFGEGPSGTLKGSITDIRMWDRVVSWEESKSIVIIVVTLQVDAATAGVLSITGSDLGGATVVNVQVPADSTVSSFKVALREKLPCNFNSQHKFVLPDGRALREADDTSLVVDIFKIKISPVSKEEADNVATKRALEQKITQSAGYTASGLQAVLPARKDYDMKITGKNKETVYEGSVFIGERTEINYKEGLYGPSNDGSGLLSLIGYSLDAVILHVEDEKVDLQIFLGSGASEGYRKKMTWLKSGSGGYYSLNFVPCNFFVRRIANAVPERQTVANPFSGGEAPLPQQSNLQPQASMSVQRARLFPKAYSRQTYDQPQVPATQQTSLPPPSYAQPQTVPPQQVYAQPQMMQPRMMQNTYMQPQQIVQPQMQFHVQRQMVPGQMLNYR